MEYDTMIAVMFYICGCFYVFFGVYTLITNKKSNISRQFLFLTLSMSVWAFAYSFSVSAPTLEASTFWNSLSVFGWGFFYGFFLHFALVLTKNTRHFKGLIKHLILYSPAIISIFLFAPFGYFSDIQYQLIPSSSGWRNFLAINIGQIWILLYSVTYSVTAVILLIRWWKTIESDSPLRRYVTYFLISIIVPFIFGFTTDLFSHVLGLTQMPKLGILFLIFPTILLFVTLRKFGVLLEIVKTEFHPLEGNVAQEENRLHLFNIAAGLASVGALGSFLAEYFIAGENFIGEFSLSLALLILGVCFLLLPHVIKKHTIQDKIFLILCIATLFFFMFNDVNTGAVTIWAVYIAFLLFSIILDNRVIALIFVIIALMANVVIWIISPEASATIDSAQYLKRIFIIIFTSLVAVYLTNEYASKLKGYKQFSKEQKVLEKISTKFISVNRDNDKEKINEMFEMSAETLDFDHGYLIDFSTDYEDAIIVSAYAREETDESLAFRSGMRLKTATLPMANVLIAQKHPVGCLDITDISIDESEEERNFFISRGILSYYALPIVLENKVIGMLVIEDGRKADLRVRHNQTHFLGMIANILSDMRQKILYEEKLYDFAYFDESTKLANRNMLKKNIEQLLHDRRESERLVIFDIELDNLRVINDSFGHNVGERIIVKSASILKKLKEDGCTLSRIAEGKFIIVMPIAETDEQIETCASKIIDAFSDPILPTDGLGSLFVTPVIGIAVYPDDGKDTNTLLQNADLAGYEAKSSDNKIVFFSGQLKNRITENTLLTNKLFMSMQNEEFSLEFQPQISCSTEKMVGVETLLRWTPDGKKRIPPDIFIPILEQTGLIHDCLLQNKNGESCRAKMEKVASPKWRKMQSSGLCSLT